jgi:hypothetical protein
MHPMFEIGTVYTVIAGLLNVLVICDAYAGPLVLLPSEKTPADDGAANGAEFPATGGRNVVRCEHVDGDPLVCLAADRQRQSGLRGDAP